MKIISYKKAFRIIIVVLCTALSLIAALVILVDPFFQYHKPLSCFHYVIDNQISQNPGMIKNFDYDSVILGSSMTVNFDTLLFDETMGLNTIKLSVNAASPLDISTYLELIQEYNSDIETVFIGIDPLNYHAEPGIMAYGCPEYLCDDNLFNDVSYLFNRDVIREYIIKPQLKKADTPLNQAYWSWMYMGYGKETIALSYTAPEMTGVTLPADSFMDNTIFNMENYIQPHIENMEDTKFVIFFPPYSILYWYNCMAEGSIPAYMAEIGEIMGRLLAYPNVEIYFFQNNYEYITNLEHYCDYTHYNHDMNDYMTYCFADGTYRVTEADYREVLQKMQDWLLAFDYESCWP